MASNENLLGSVVAFEGQPDTISTQLRLLPTSSQILVLPNIQAYLSKDDLLDDFEACNFIKRIHNALATRSQAAQAFLNGATPNNKRLVFMNGGTPGAQALCIKAIMKHETDGDYAKAEAIFNCLVRDGVAGLEDSSKAWKRRKSSQYFDEAGFDEFEDPITRAMRAADALDRQTASLQPSNELDLTIRSRSRSNSLPLYGYTDNLGEAAPFFVFGGQNDDDAETCYEESAEDIYTLDAPKFSVTQYGKPSEKSYSGFAGFQPLSPRSCAPKSPSCVGESYKSMAMPPPIGPNVFTPRSDVFSIRSTDNVVYGEASLLDMRLSERRATLSRVKSLDRIYPTTPKYRDLCLPPEPLEPEKYMSKEPRRHSCMVISSANGALPRRLSYIEGPRTIVVRSNRPTVKVAPVPADKKRKPARSSYVDRGTDADELPELTEPFLPVFPFTENLVVHFKEKTSDLCLEVVVRDFKTGNYPIRPSSPTGSEANDSDISDPGTPKSGSIHHCSRDGGLKESTVAYQHKNGEEYDPFAYTPSSWSPSKPPNNLPILKVERPPTPAKTPPPAVKAEADEKIHEFEVTSQQTAVTIQNELRAILKLYFPPETQGYRQFQFPLLPELEGLWKPIFRVAEPGSPRENNRRMDQILAIGSQREVKREYASAIIGRLEKLGTKLSGVSRSGRLDFRYLLANAMQAYTAQPLANQAHDNPFNNSYLLATLIIPHLETYLALHSEVRFLLLEYPPEHLPTMIALQKLVGVDLMKVAQIVDSKSKDLLSFTHLRGTQLNSNYKQGAGTRGEAPLPPLSGFSYDITVSKANFLLTSTASESEITTLISTVHKILSNISSFYAAEETPRKPSAKKGKPSPLQGTFSAFPKVTPGLHSPPMSPAMTSRFGSGPPSTRASSIAETIKTSRSIKSKLSLGKPKKRSPYADTQSILTVDLSDSEWDLEDRRIMPTLIRKPTPEKGNSRKALKFLGLA